MINATLNKAALINNSGNATYVSAVIAWLSSFTLNDVVMLVSLFLGISTFAVNWYYKHRADKRQERLSQPNKGG